MHCYRIVLYYILVCSNNMIFCRARLAFILCTSATKYCSALLIHSAKEGILPSEMFKKQSNISPKNAKHDSLWTISRVQQVEHILPRWLPSICRGILYHFHWIVSSDQRVYNTANSIEIDVKCPWLPFHMWKCNRRGGEAKSIWEHCGIDASSKVDEPKTFRRPSRTNCAWLPLFCLLITRNNSSTHISFVPFFVENEEIIRRDITMNDSYFMQSFHHSQQLQSVKDDQCRIHRISTSFIRLHQVCKCAQITVFQRDETACSIYMLSECFRELGSLEIIRRGDFLTIFAGSIFWIREAM